jgi:hypothetical protein
LAWFIVVFIPLTRTVRGTEFLRTSTQTREDE